MTEEHQCEVCGASLNDDRADVCSAACRRELSRVQALRAGGEDPPYRTIGLYDARRQRRLRRAEPGRVDTFTRM